MGTMTSRKWKAIIWLAGFAVVYSWCVWSIANCVKPLPRWTTENQPQAVGGFSPDGKFLLTADIGHEAPFEDLAIYPISIWNASTGRLLRRIDAPQLDIPNMPISRAWFSALGSKFAVSAQPNVSVYDLESGEMRLSIENIERTGCSYDFSWDGRKFICCGRGIPQQFNLEKGQTKITWENDFQILRHPKSPGSSCPLEFLDKAHIRTAEFTRCGAFFLIERRRGGESTGRFELFDTTSEPKLIRSFEKNDELSLSCTGKELWFNGHTGRESIPIGGGLQKTSLPIEGVTGKTDRSEKRFRIDDSESIYVDYMTNEKNNTGKFVRWCVNPKVAANNVEFAAEEVEANARFALNFEDISADQSEDLALAVRHLGTGTHVVLEHVGKLGMPDLRIAGTAGVAFTTDWGLIEKVSSSEKKWNAMLLRFQALSKFDISKLQIPAKIIWTEVWDLEKACSKAFLSDVYGLDISTDGKSIVTQNEKHEVQIWDFCPRRNWRLASALAFIPALILTAVLLIFVSLSSRIFRRLRPVSNESN